MLNKIKKNNNIICLNKKELNFIIKRIETYKNEEIIAIYNPNCIGIMNSAKDLFTNLVPISELVNKKQIESISRYIADSNIKQVIFFSTTIGWNTLMEKIYEKNSKIKLKVFWHGSHSLFVMNNESDYLYSIIELLERGILYSIAFAKESMAAFYKQKGYNSYFLPNKIPDVKDIYDVSGKENNNDIKSNNKIKIGLYSAGNRWEKNTFNQLSAMSLLDNVIVDVIPSTKLVKDFCKLMNINLSDGGKKHISRKELFERMSKNDINLYVTFSECSPVLPLESLELGVPCITGNNHHYFKNSKLFDYLVVNSEDNVDEIVSKIKLALENKNEILQQYAVWKNEYSKLCQEKLAEFVKV